MAKFKIFFIGSLLFITLFSLKSCKKKVVNGCTDSKASNYNAQATSDDGSCTYPPTIKNVGETYQGGIIFYVDITGLHGLISATADQSNSMKWHNGTVVLIGGTGNAVGTGVTNTTAIVGALGSGGTNYAARICDELVSGGYSDWFLPSRDELNLMYTNLFKAGLGNFSNARYWTSSEFDVTNALYLEFNNGTIASYDKINGISVRAARAF